MSNIAESRDGEKAKVAPVVSDTASEVVPPAELPAHTAPKKSARKSVKQIPKRALYSNRRRSSLDLRTRSSGEKRSESIVDKINELMSLLHFYRVRNKDHFNIRANDYIINITGPHVIITKNCINPVTLDSDDEIIDKTKPTLCGDISSEEEDEVQDKASDSDGYCSNESMGNIEMDRGVKPSVTGYDSVKRIYSYSIHDIPTTRIAIGKLEGYVEHLLIAKQACILAKADTTNWGKRFLRLSEDCYELQRILGCMYHGRLLYPCLQILKEAITRTLDNFVCCEDQFGTFQQCMFKIIEYIQLLEEHLTSVDRHRMVLNFITEMYSQPAGNEENNATEDD